MPLPLSFGVRLSLLHNNDEAVEDCSRAESWSGRLCRGSLDGYIWPSPFHLRLTLVSYLARLIDFSALHTTLLQYLQHPQSLLSDFLIPALHFPRFLALYAFILILSKDVSSSVKVRVRYPSGFGVLCKGTRFDEAFD